MANALKGLLPALQRIAQAIRNAMLNRKVDETLSGLSHRMLKDIGERPD